MKPQSNIVLKVVEKEPKYNRVYILLRILLWIYLVINTFICISVKSLCIYSIILFIIIFLLNILYPFIKKSFIEKDKIYLNNDIIIIGKETINIRNIKTIKFKFIGCKGDFYPGAFFGVGFLGLQQGDNNYLYFVDSNEKEYRFKILINNNYEKAILKKLFLNYKSIIHQVKFEE